MKLQTTDKVNKDLSFKLLQSVVEEANDAVLITKADPIEAPNGPEIIYVNRAFEKMTGYKAAEVIGKTPRILQGDKSESDQLQTLRDAVREKKSVNVDVINYNKNGDQYWINISLSPIFDGDKCTHFISIQRDVTDQILWELEQKELQERLDQDIQARKKTELRLQERNRHIDAIASLNLSLLNYENWFVALENHMEMIGEAVQADRVYYFENRYDPVTGEGFSSQKLEWCREGISPQMESEDLQEMPFKEVPELVDPMIQNRPSSESLSSIAMGTTTRHIMEDQDIKTFLAIPISIRGKFFGFVGFDNCTVESKWSDEEVRTLTTITSNLAVAIERHLAEKERQELLGERNIILESISDAFYAIDQNWEITYFNKEAENLLGKKAEEVMGNRFWDEFASARDTDLFENYQEVMNQKVPKSFEYYYPLLGSWYDISAYPAENGISVYFKNIDDKIRNQKRILEKTRQLDAIAQFNGLLIKEEGWQEALDKCLEMFCKVAAADRIYFFEYYYLEETGQDVVAMKMEWVREGISPEIDNPDHHNLPFDDIRSFIDKIIYEGGFNEIVSEIKNREFAEFLAGQNIKSILAIPVFVGKEFRGFIGFDDCLAERSWSEDEVTFLKTIAINLGSAIENEESERRLIELNQSLEKQTKELANSNSELEKFAYVASHDLQEPLRMITSFLSQLERKYEELLDEKGKQYIHFATDGAKRMRQIIQDLLEYSRVGRIDMKREDVDMNELLQSVTILQRKMIEEKSAKIDWEALPTVKANKGAMQQLIQNLIQNALNYQKKGNKPKIKIWSEEADNHLKFYIMDNGIGIDPKFSDQIFTIFQRLHGRDEYSGTGVGLAICKKIVEDHGGIIGVDSELGNGSTFYFTIEKNPIEIESNEQNTVGS